MNEFDNSSSGFSMKSDSRATTPQPGSVAGFPAVYYGPGESRVIASADDIPEGWEDHPGKVKAEKEDDMTALRAEYTAKMGKKPYMGWDEATLREKLA